MAQGTPSTSDQASGSGRYRVARTNADCGPNPQPILGLASRDAHW